MSGHRARNYDVESGKNRTQNGRRPFPNSNPFAALTQQHEQHEEGADEDSTVEEFARAAVQDDSVRPNTTVERKPNQRGAPIQKRTGATEASSEHVETVKEKEVTTANHVLLLLSAARGINFAPVTYPETSTFIPTALNLFTMAASITKVIGDNIIMIKRMQDYTSEGFYTYCGFLYYYQILRAREASQVLTRMERRSLKIFESLGKPEAWPVANPLIGFIQSLGAVQSPDKMFTHIVPRFPDFSSLGDSKGLTKLHELVGGGRIPIIPAYQQFMHIISKGNAYYNDDFTFIPTDDIISTNFVGIKSSQADSEPFQALAFNDAWNDPLETTEPVGNYQWGAREARLRRWNIPEVANKADLSKMEQFLFGDQENTHWIKSLLKLASHVNAFFPGSTNLSAIPPSTTMENFATTHYSMNVSAARRGRTSAARTPRDNTWYQPRNNWYITVKAHHYGDISDNLNKIAATTAVTATYDSNIIPSTPISLTKHFSNEQSGPYFKDISPDISVPLIQAEAITQQDPSHLFTELVESTSYDVDGKA